MAAHIANHTIAEIPAAIPVEVAAFPIALVVGAFGCGSEPDVPIETFGDGSLGQNDLPDGLDLGPVVAIDCETMGLNPQRDRLCVIQMSGGDMEMDYDHETTYFKGHCIEYDTVDMFQMLVDIALEPRSVLAANVAKSKNRKSHALAEHLKKYDPFAFNEELLMKTAYGYNTLGLPRLGLEGNVENIDARILQKFVMDNVTPKK